MHSALYDLDDLKNIIGNEEMMKASLDSLHDLAYDEKKRTRSEGHMPFFPVHFVSNESFSSLKNHWAKENI